MKNLSRQTLQETAFCDIPSSIGGFQLRRLSASSFTLLGRLENPMMVGKKQLNADDAPVGTSQQEMFDAVIQYVWVHNASIEQVICIETNDDLPVLEIRKLGYEISIGEALNFLAKYQESALRMTANLAVTAEDDDTPGKPLESPRVGSPVSSSPAVPVEIPSEKDTSSGSCPSNEPLPISMLPTFPTEQDVSGPLAPETCADAPPIAETTPLN